MDNQLIADAFDQMGDLLEFKGENPFRIRAYRNGAKAIRDLDEAVADILKDSSRKLSDVPGIGKTLVEKAQVLVDTGGLPQLDKLNAEFPPSLMAMTKIPGLGAKKAAVLHKELGINNLDELREACQQQKVRELKGFAAKSEQAILDGLEIAEAAAKRLRWADADQWVGRLREHLQSCKAINKLEFAGSYRRRRDTVGDLDILVVANDADAVMDHLEAFPQRVDTIMRGGTKMSIRIDVAFQVDLRVVEEHQFGAALQYFTGSQAHNIRVRAKAKAKGLRVNEYGVFKEGTEDSIAGASEEDVYATVDMPVFPPELREDRLEFDWAEQGDAIELIQVEDIRCDLHMHTTATDGKATIAEMADAAIGRGLAAIAITDHSKRVSMAMGLDETRLREQWKRIDELRPEYEGRLEILKGIECDILENGEMDLSDEVLSDADWVLASVHYGQRQSRQQITDRIVGAICNPHVTAIAHPTGRLLNRRDAYEVDLGAVFQAAQENATLLELNANPARLDLNEVHCQNASRRYKIPIVINTDAHSIDGLDVMKYGILQARRAGLQKQHVANARSWHEMKPLIGKYQ